MSRRTFRHEGERRTWSVDVDGPTLVLRMTDDDAPDDVLTRKKACRTPDDARREAAQLVAEQLAAGLVELDPPPPPEAPRPYFARLAREWSGRSGRWDVEAALGSTLALDDTFLARIHDAIERLASADRTETSSATTWLSMQLPLIAPALLLALRDPRHLVWQGALGTLEALRDAHRGVLEAPLLGIIEHLPPAAHPGAERTPAHLRAALAAPLSDGSVARLCQLTTGPDPEVACNAALLLARYPHLARRDVLTALHAWSHRTDLDRWVLAAVVLEHAVPELGAALHRDPRRAATRAELQGLLERALARPPSPI